MRLYVLSEDTITEESQRVTTIHPLFDAVAIGRVVVWIIRVKAQGPRRKVKNTHLVGPQEFRLRILHTWLQFFHTETQGTQRLKAYGDRMLG